MSSREEEIPDVVELPIDGCLDLHAFAPKDCKSLIPDYLALCAERGIFEVRIIHSRKRARHPATLGARHPGAAAARRTFLSGRQQWRRLGCDAGDLVSTKLIDLGTSFAPAT